MSGFLSDRTPEIDGLRAAIRELEEKLEYMARQLELLDDKVDNVDRRVDNLHDEMVDRTI